MAFSPDGKTSACGDSDGVISFWDIGAGTQVRPVPRHEMGLNSVAVSPDGRTVATASGDRSIRLWDMVSAKELRILRGHTKGVQFVAFSPNGKRLASASFDDSEWRGVDDVFVWDLGPQVKSCRG